MSCVIQIVGMQMPWGLVRCPESDRYVMDFDPEKHDGIGHIPTTRVIERAACFRSTDDAMAFLNLQSTVVPLRDDRAPNRPLAAFSVFIIQTTRVIPPMTPRPGFNWTAVSWGGPDEPIAEACSLCEAPIGEDSVPLILWNPQGWCARFCRACQKKWWGVESIGGGNDEDDD